ncbi:MAG TPA: hypothetical protein VM120_06920 [Bryobacteraceae bacterium]|nr:hypothetical protein [Bryobacteraceae bacterium]
MTGSNDERRALALLKNHAEFRATLVPLKMSGDLLILESHVSAVTRKWFELARVHYADALAADVFANPRAVYSRAYYAAYNASKAVRYVVRGFVSLRGDDHKKVADLPDNFPEVDSWVARLPLLYEHRLRADYDNWSETASENQLSPSECLAAARDFLTISEQYLLTQYGLEI